MTDYALWEVILNSDSPPPTRSFDGVEKPYPPITVEEKLVRKNELKARKDIRCAGSDHDHYQEATCAHHEDHMMHDSYVKDNEVPVVHSDVSSVPTNAFMMIYDDMCEPHDQSVSYPSRNTAVQNSLTAELATYKEHVELYEQRAKFKLTEREQKINK
nr:hypothetical protein [Tanacetum cinerariifolium]